MKKIEKKIKDYLIKLYPLNKLYFFLKILKKSKKRYHYADNGEDVIIQGLFNHRKDGFYIDVGCYHPIRASLTHLLYKKGWKGGRNFFELYYPAGLTACPLDSEQYRPVWPGAGMHVTTKLAPDQEKAIGTYVIVLAL